jgi:predicted ATPase/DNA-binding SARP family transcriptional activator
VTGDLAIRVLGPFELRRGPTVLSAGGPTQRAVLANLALRAGQPVAVDEVVEGIWGESDEPLSGSGSIQVHVSRIRTLLKGGGAQPLVTVPGGYRLEADVVSVDAVDFERLLGIGRQQLMAREERAAVASLNEALALWRGPALMDLRNFPFADRVAERLDELRVDAAEERIAAQMALGEERATLPELQSLIADHPYRERLHAQLMQALYRAGQQAAALDAYQAARTRLEVDLGVEPGPELERLHRAILAHDAELTAVHPELPAPEATRVTSSGPPRRLPTAPSLIGREALLGELEHLSGEHRLLTLTGPGGSGKTSLALGLLHRLAPRFADGAAFVDLAPVARPDQVLPAIAAGLGVSLAGGRLHERLIDVLAERKMVVVIDNLEHLLAAAPDLALLVDATAGLFIATSRIRLALRAEHIIQVPSLPVPTTDEAAGRPQQPAVELFLRAAVAAGGQVGTAASELAAVGRICRAVDGLPLAIEIAAAQTRVETVVELADHLSERLAGLRGHAHDAPARQRTMEAAIGWSVDRLDTEQRRAFERLAVFAGAFNASGAAVVLETNRQLTIERLADLLDASLLGRHPSAAGRAQFRMLEPVRSVARVIGEPDELAAAAERHAAFIRAEIKRLCPVSSGIQRPEDLSQLRVLHDDLIAALGHLAAAAPDERVDLIVQLEEYWIWTGREIVAVALVNDDLERGDLSDRAACAALTLRAQFGIMLGRMDQARTDVDLALELVPRVAEPAISARAYVVAAYLLMTTGEWPAARSAGATAVEWARKAGDGRLLAQSLAVVADGHINQAPATQVRGWIDEGLRIARAGGMAHVETILLAVAQGFYDEVEHNLEVAAEYARLAFELAQRFGSPEREAFCANNLGTSIIYTGGPAEDARAILLGGLRTIDRIGHRLAALYLLGSLGEAEAAIGRWRNAVILICAVAGIAETMGAGQVRHPVANADAVLEAATRELGTEAAADARRAAERMTYRDAVDFALELSAPAASVTPS